MPPRPYEELPPAEARRRQEAGAILVDVREPDEWAAGHISGALHVPQEKLDQDLPVLVPDRKQTLVCCCAGGMRSALAALALTSLGYEQVFSLAGGVDAWRQAGLPLVTDESAEGAFYQRYSRHIRIPEIGEAGQRRLLEARVLCVGAGGLGCPAALYLAAAGVGTLGVVDSDVVDLTNLQRQILHRTDTIGQPKTRSAAAALEALNPDCRVVPHQLRLDRHNALDLVGDYDLVLDGCDNFATRYLVNDACVLAGRPSVYGAIYRFEGQVSVFVPGQGPCYRCLFPAPPPPEAAPSCDQAGVLGVLPGLVGVLQATEALKVLLGLGEPLVGKLLFADTLRAGFRVFSVPRNPACAVCGDHPTVRELIDYEAWVGEVCRGPGS